MNAATLLMVIRSELIRQAEEGKPGPYVDCRSANSALIDGHIDLLAVAKAVADALETEARERK